MKAINIAENTSASIVLPDGFELVSGNPEWHGDVIPGNKYEISATVKAVKIGEWEIVARAFYRPNKTDQLGGSAVLFAYVSEDSAIVSDVPLGPTIGHGGPAGPPPPGWKPPPGYENITPIPTSPPPISEPPGQAVPPPEIPSSPS